MPRNKTSNFAKKHLGEPCYWCGAIPASPTADHLLPRSKGGADRVSNLVLSCWECNQWRGNTLVQDMVFDEDSECRVIDALRTTEPHLDAIMAKLGYPIGRGMVIELARRNGLVLAGLPDIDIPKKPKMSRKQWSRVGRVGRGCSAKGKPSISISTILAWEYSR